MPSPRSPTVAVLAAAVGCTGLLALGPVLARSPQLHEGLRRGDVEALATGKLLIAARRLPDPNFARTVVLLADFGREGAMGIVVNRRSDVPLARVFPNLVPTLTTSEPAFLGGPVAKTDALALVRTTAGTAHARHVVDGVHLITSRQALEALFASGAASTRIRVYLGYAGWGPGQLEAETEQGAWHVLAGDAAVVFDADPSATWQRLIVRTEVIQVRQRDRARTISASRNTLVPAAAAMIGCCAHGR